MTDNRELRSTPGAEEFVAPKPERSQSTNEAKPVSGLQIAAERARELFGNIDPKAVNPEQLRFIVQQESHLRQVVLADLEASMHPVRELTPVEKAAGMKYSGEGARALSDEEEKDRAEFQKIISEKVDKIPGIQQARFEHSLEKSSEQAGIILEDLKIQEGLAHLYPDAEMAVTIDNKHGGEVSIEQVGGQRIEPAVLANLESLLRQANPLLVVASRFSGERGQYHKLSRVWSEGAGYKPGREGDSRVAQKQMSFAKVLSTLRQALEVAGKKG